MNCRTRIEYKYFDSELGSQWYPGSWSPVLTDPIDERHRGWAEKEIARRIGHSDVIVTRILCDGVQTFYKPIHCWA